MVPKLWTDTIEGHRREVRHAILETTAALAAEHGVLSVTMSQIAEGAGIGRATLYKYFPDVESILFAWHEAKITGHLEQLAALRDRDGDATSRLAAVLEAYALITHQSDASAHPELEAVLHPSRLVTHAHHQLRAMISELVAEGATAGAVRDDVTPGELAGYCLHALAGASALPSKAAVRRLVKVTLAGLRPPVPEQG